LQVSILATVFGLGLQATWADLLYVVRRPGLLARSLLAILVIMPVVTLALVRMFDFAHAVKVVLVALAISPLPPILPRKETSAGGHVSYGLGLMIILALVAIPAIPLTLGLLGRVVGREFAISPATIAGLVFKSTILPLLAGVLVRAVLPAVAERIRKPVNLVGTALLAVAALAVLASALPAIWAAIGNGTLAALAIVSLVGLTIGHLLGGPSREHAVVLALSTACRHPAIALTIASANFPDQRFGAIILLHLLVSGVVAIPYLKWQRRPTPGTAHAV
jgi:BASS family bile acid:Na+ symporter